MLPFQAGDPATGELFYNREQILRELYISTVSLKAGTHQDFVIVSPRRYGKTSILKMLEQKLLREKVAAVYVDCSHLFPDDLKTFFERYMTCAFETYSRLDRWGILPQKIEKAVKGAPEAITSFIARIASKVGGEFAENFKFWIEFMEKPSSDISKVLNYTFNLPETLAARRKIPCVVMFDEFQELQKYDKTGKLMWTIRSIIQHHKHTAYVITGSSVGMLSRLMTKDAPFYGLFMTRKLEPFSDEDAMELLEDRAKKGGTKFSEDAIDVVIEKTAGIPFYLQWLGLNAYLLALDGRTKTITPEMVKLAYERGLKSVPQLERDLGLLTGRLSDVLKAMALEDLTTPSTIARRLRMKDEAVIRELGRLSGLGYVAKKARGKYEIIDRVFRDWLKTRFG